MPETSKRLITAEDLYRFQNISGTRISPDGKTMVYARPPRGRENGEEIFQPVDRRGGWQQPAAPVYCG